MLVTTHAVSTNTSKGLAHAQAFSGSGASLTDGAGNSVGVGAGGQQGNSAVEGVFAQVRHVKPLYLDVLVTDKLHLRHF